MKRLALFALLVGVLVGSSAGRAEEGPAIPKSPEPAPKVELGIPVYLHNKSPFKIYATTVVRVNKQWKTIAFQQIDPGQKVGPIAHTDNRIVYFHGHTDDPKTFWGGDALFRNLNGARTGFVRGDFPGNSRTYTFNFNFIPPPDNEPAPMDEGELKVL